MVNLILAIAISWVHVTFEVEGHNTSAGIAIHSARNAISTIDFYVDTSMVIKLMDFNMITADGQDTIKEKNGFLIDFSKDSVYTIDFIANSKASSQLTDEWDYLAMTSAKPSISAELKDFELKMKDSTHAEVKAVIVRHDIGDISITLEGVAELTPITDSMKKLMNYKPNSTTIPLIDYMAIPVTIGEAIFGRVMKALDKEILDKGYFVTNMNLTGIGRGKSVFTMDMEVLKLEYIPREAVLPIIQEFNTGIQELK